MQNLLEQVTRIIRADPNSPTAFYYLPWEQIHTRSLQHQQLQGKTRTLNLKEACNLIFFFLSNRRFWNPYKVNTLSEEPELPVWGIILVLFSNPRVTEPIPYTLSAPSHTSTQTKRFQEQNLLFLKFALLYHFIS